MRNVPLVIKHEITSTLGKPSFWLTTFVFPLLVLAITFGSQFVAQNLMEEAVEEEEARTAAAVTGYVDAAGIIEELPEGIPEEQLRAYPDEEAAAAALEAGEIERYYLISRDFVDTGELTLVSDAASPFGALDGGGVMEYVVTYNLTEDAATTGLLLEPLPQVAETDLTPAVAAGPEGDGEGEGLGDGPLASIVVYAVIFIFFFILTMSSGYMLRSVSKEKENRVVEMLLLSLRPRELMLGKIVALSFVALLQMGIWLGGSMLIVERREAIFNLATAAAAFELPAGFLAWSLLYFALGYALFASALGALGALAPNAREGSQFTFAVLLPLMLPLWFNSVFAQAPDGPVATAFSIIPFTSPVSMMARMVATTVPLWQILLSLGLLAATAYAFVLLSARFFRADTLLSNRALSWGRIREELMG